MSVFTSTVALNLKETLEEIITDNTDGVESRAVFKEWMAIRSMEDAYEDDLEVAGIGLAAQIPEGSEIPEGNLREGYVKRYTALKFGILMRITEEAMDDSKYDKVIQAAKRNKRALWKTADIHCTRHLVNATNASFPGADGVALASTSHPLAQGGTFSNMLAVAMAPSTAAWNNIVAQLDQMVDHDGVIEGYEPEAVVFPSQQWGIWHSLTNSQYDPRAGNFSEVNIVKANNAPKLVKNRYWTNTTTNYCVLTNADNGFQHRWRKKPKARSWIKEEQEIINHSVTARWDNGLSEPRAMFFVNS